MIYYWSFTVLKFRPHILKVRKREKCIGGSRNKDDQLPSPVCLVVLVIVRLNIDLVNVGHAYGLSFSVVLPFSPFVLRIRRQMNAWIFFCIRKNCMSATILT